MASSPLKLGEDENPRPTVPVRTHSTFDKFMDISVDGVQTTTMDTIVSDFEGPSKTKPKAQGRSRKRAISPSRILPIPNLPSINHVPTTYSTIVSILHLDHDGFVAQGKVGASWKTTKGCMGPLYEPGQKMVQVHKIFTFGVPLMFLEDRHHATTLDKAIILPR
jgi:hypothetical protein